MVLGIPYSKNYTLIIAGLAYLVFSIASLFWGIGVSPQLYSIGVVTFYFVVGVVFYVWRDQIPFHGGLFLLSTGLVFLASLYPNLCVVVSPLVAYMTIYLGFIPQLAIPFLKGRDYSYGVYLYGFPITQALVALNPLIDRLSLFALGILATILVAMCSWHWVEKPALKLKKFFVPRASGVKLPK